MTPDGYGADCPASLLALGRRAGGWAWKSCTSGGVPRGVCIEGFWPVLASQRHLVLLLAHLLYDVQPRNHIHEIRVKEYYG